MIFRKRMEKKTKKYIKISYYLYIMDFICKYCKHKYKNDKSLLYHIKKYHKDDIEKENDIIVKKYYCKKCNKETHKKNIL